MIGVGVVLKRVEGKREAQQKKGKSQRTFWFFYTKASERKNWRRWKPRKEGVPTQVSKVTADHPSVAAGCLSLSPYKEQPKKKTWGDVAQNAYVRSKSL